ncbi:universal stress protein [Cupriavidus sp. CuC1]|uniref:universal stress protein n=1 Tax=Cupriavidus sp. CuC1 TaxID=3373131 RepID=UPI0037CF8D41
MLTILVPVDGTECALCAVRHAAFLFREHSVAKVVLLNVQEPLEMGRAAAFHSLSELRKLERQEGEEALQRACEILDDSGVTYDAQIGVGSRATTIVRAATANQCDGIIMGTTARSHLGALLGGGLAGKVVRRARVPVTLVKTSGGPTPPPPPQESGRPRAHHAHPSLAIYLSAF